MAKPFLRANAATDERSKAITEHPCVHREAFFSAARRHCQRRAEAAQVIVANRSKATRKLGRRDLHLRRRQRTNYVDPSSHTKTCRPRLSEWMRAAHCGFARRRRPGRAGDVRDLRTVGFSSRWKI